MGSQVRILSIRLAWEYRFPWTRPERADQAVWPALPASGINTSVTTGKKGRRALEDEGIQTFSLGVIPRASTRKPAILFRPADNTSPPCDVSEKTRQCGCGAVAARLLPKQEIAGSNPVIRSIRKTKTMDLIRQWDSQPSFPCGRFRKNMDEQPRHGHAASRNKETCHRLGSSEEEQVPFKHWVRIS